MPSLVPFHPRSLFRQTRALAPGLALCVAVSLASWGLQTIEFHLFGRVWLEALVLAILLGTAVRSLWQPPAGWDSGIGFSAKTLLEVAVLLLGASVSARVVAAMGLPLLGGIAAIVLGAITASYGLGRALGLTHRMALLVACGNSICGNSAIAAVAPVIGADGKDVAASIAFTAVLGVAVVLGLPLLAPLLHLRGLQFGTLAGLTVYAVPQVLAATAAAGAAATQMGTLVKLTRVLMLGPVVLILSLAGTRQAGGRRPRLHRLVPWFILGFLALAGLRTAGALPASLLPPMADAANWLTVLSMAGLGLGVDVRSVGRAGARVSLAVTASLLLLGGGSLGLIRLLG